MPASTAPLVLLKAGKLSVNGKNCTVEVAEAAAFWLFHSPPPVVPTNTWFPEASEGSKAIAETRPVTNPN